MLARSHHQLVVSFLLLFSLVILMLSGCDNVPPNSNGNTHQLNTGVTLTVGGKKEAEAELLTKMYTLLLRKAGFTVVEKPDIPGNEAVFQAITQGTIDLYPEFTTTGLGKLNILPTHNAEQDYLKVKQGYESQYHITWLDPAPLNDTYGICTLKSITNIHDITNISQLTTLAPQLTIAVQTDGKSAYDSAAKTYGFQFSLTSYPTEVETYQALINGQAQINLCYTTDPLISIDNFVLLNDDKNAFPFYNPAPIVRDDILSKSPQIASILNVLAPRLTTDVSVMLQRQVVAGFSVTDVATNWLKGQGLL